MSKRKSLMPYANGQKTLDELDEALYYLSVCLEMARQPSTDQEDDPAAMHGELREMQIHIRNAKHRAGSVRRILYQLADAIRRLHDTNTQMQGEMALAYQRGKEEMFQLLMGDLDDEKLDQLLILIDQWAKDSEAEDIEF